MPAGSTVRRRERVRRRLALFRRRVEIRSRLRLKIAVRCVRNVQRRSGIFIAYRTLVIREVRELSTPGELNNFLPAIMGGSVAERRTCGANRSVECVQWMHRDAHRHPGDTTKFAVRKEGKEEHEEFLVSTVSSQATYRLLKCVCGRTVNACHTIWRFIKS